MHQHGPDQQASRLEDATSEFDRIVAALEAEVARHRDDRVLVPLRVAALVAVAVGIALEVSLWRVNPGGALLVAYALPVLVLATVLSVERVMVRLSR
jgi:hypothetical protein